MLTIRKTQIDALAANQLNGFRTRLKQHLITYFPQAVPLNDTAWDELLNQGLTAAHKYRLKTEECIMVYFNVMLTLGTGFEQREVYGWAAPLLNDMTLREKEKIRRLIAQTEASL